MSLGAGATNTRTYTFAPTSSSITGISAASATASFLSTVGTTNTATITLLSTAVAPIASTSGAGTVYLLAGSGISTTAGHTITNSGNGNLSGAGAASNLNASAAPTTSLGTGWTGSAASVSLADAATSTSIFTYKAQTTRSLTPVATTITSAFTNGSVDGANKSVTLTTTLTGQTVAPVANISSSNAGAIRVGTKANATVNVSNTGDGDFVGVKLTGTVGAAAGSPVLTGAGGAVALKDSTAAAFNFVYAPTTRGTSATATVVTKLDNGGVLTAGKGNGTNAASTSTQTLTGSAVGPIYSADLNTKGNAIAGGATILFGDLNGGITLQDLLVSNITPDLGGTSLTNLTLSAAIINDPSNEFSFSLAGFDTGGFGSALRSATNVANLGDIAIQFAANLTGTFTAQLQITTDENAALGVAGSVYVYNLAGAAAVVPEPGTLMVLGVGMLGLAISRRRRGVCEPVNLTSNVHDDETV